MQTAKSRRGKSVRTSVLLPEESYASVQALAEAHDVSAAWVIRHALLKFLSEQQDDPQLPLLPGRS